MSNPQMKTSPLRQTCAACSCEIGACEPFVAVHPACVPRWILVTERLPLAFSWVLIAADPRKWPDMRVQIGRIDDDDCWVNTEADDLTVTHWTPLPAPPEPKP